MGLPKVWVDVAEHVGFDKFMDVWRALSTHADDAGNSRRVRVPCYSLYTRYQRNRYIQGLATSMEPKAILKHIKNELGEELSYRQVLRLIPNT